MATAESVGAPRSDGDLAFWCRAVAASGIAALDRLGDRVRERDSMRSPPRGDALADGMRFEFLYDRRRRIFAIGYRLADAEGPGRLDASFYDLLASEARLASFVAIAKGDVPQHHWFHLGRLVTNVDGRATLMSWGGTMFEYLMPLLLMRSFPGTLLDQSCRASVRRQIDYGAAARRAVGHLRVGVRLHRSRRQLSVPGVRRPRPGAEARAGRRSRRRAVRDRAGQPDRSGGRGARTSRGSRARGSTAGSGSTNRSTTGRGCQRRRAPPDGLGAPAIVRAFFAHHQGMSLVALANVLCDDVFVTALPRRPARPGDRAAAPGARPARSRSSRSRGRPKSATRGAVGSACSRRDGSGRRTRRARTRSFCRTAATPRRSPTPAAGSARGEDLAVTRQREDRTSDAGAHYIYLRDPVVGRRLVADLPADPAASPTSTRPRSTSTRSTFRRRDGDFETQLQIAVSPEDDVEVRRLSITNRGDRPREIEVTSYAEIVLGAPEDDLAHPAFGKLFIETEYDAAERRPALQPAAAQRRRGASLGVPRPRRRGPARRRRRVGNRPRAVPRPRPLARQPDRARRTRAVGHDRRGARSDRGAARPRAARAGRVRAHDVRHRRRAGSRRGARAGRSKYRDGSAASRAFSMAFTHVHITLQHLGLSDDHAMLLRSAGLARLRRRRLVRQPGGARARTRFGQPNLWGYGISGDLPIVLVRVDARPTPCRSSARCCSRRSTGASRTCAPTSSSSTSIRPTTSTRCSSSSPDWSGAALERLEGQARRHVPAAHRTGMPDADRHLLSAVARVVLRGELGDSAPQLDRHGAVAVEPPTTCRAPRMLRAPATGRRAAAGRRRRVMENGLGGFTPDGREYVVVLDGDRETPLPWSNVIANREFGTMVSSSGAAYTWSGNSRENRLTPFANDPITDPTGEAIYLRDEDSGDGVGRDARPAARVARDAGRWVIRHAAGVTRYQHAVDGLEQELTVCVDAGRSGQALACSRSPTPRRRRGGSACSATSSGASARREPASAGSSSPRSMRRPARSSRGTPTTRSSRTRGVLPRHRTAAFVDLRSRRVHRA